MAHQTQTTLNINQKGVNKPMPFKDGVYQHVSGFTLMVQNGVVMLSPNHPMSIRLSELFDTTKWKEMK